MQEPSAMGRFFVEVVVANNLDVGLSARRGEAIPASVKHLRVRGLVDTGAMRLVLPQRIADELQLPRDGETMVRYADQRREKRAVVSNVWLQFEQRHGIFSAVIEPAREDALIGVMVLEELDLVVDCVTQALRPREPDSTLTEIE
jgi:predicted aspartyl protease